MSYNFTRTGAQIEEIHNTVDDPKSNTQFSDDIRTIAGEYRGLWPDTGGSANKGDTYQTQVSGNPTGQYFTALQDTTVNPVGDDVNWQLHLSKTYVDEKNQSQDDEIQENSQNISSLDSSVAQQEGRISTNESDISSLQAGQGSGVVGYATQAELFSDLNHPENTVGLITNDPTPTNNTNYIKTGSSGSGSWTQGGDTLSAQAYQKATALEPQVEANSLNRNLNQTTFTRGFINLIDPSDPEYGEPGKFNGNFIDGLADYQHSGLIACKPGDVISVNVNNRPSSIGLFNSDMVQLNTLSTTFNENSVREATIPTTSGGVPNNVPAFMAANWLNADAGTVNMGFGDWQPNEGAFAPFSEESGEATNESFIKSITSQVSGDDLGDNSINGKKVTFTSSFTNSIDPSDPEYGAAGKFNGNFIDGLADYQHSGLISCNPGDLVSMVNTSPSTFAVFNSDMVQLNAVSTVTGSDGVRTGTIPETSGGLSNNVPAFFAVNWLNEDLGTVTAGVSAWAPPAFYPFGEELVRLENDFLANDIANPYRRFRGKRMAALGDSITVWDPKNWTDVVAQIFECEVSNYGASGGHWEDFDSPQFQNQWFTVQVTNLLADTSNAPDFIVVAMGTNSLAAVKGDFTTQTSGALGSEDTTTVYGGMRNGLQRLRNAFPSAPILLATQLQRANMRPDQGDFLAMTEAIESMSNFFSCGLIPAGEQSGISSIIETEGNVLLIDGLHPTDAGAEVQGKFMASQIASKVNL